ncbi:MAG: ABC transporter permease [Gammaproteobacteria bacterium]
MIDSFYLAWKYIRFNKARTATLIACVTLIAFLPPALQRLLEESEREFMSRAHSTPLIVGAKGSALDLVMNALYFSDDAPQPITMGSKDAVQGSGLAAAIPMYVRFKVRGQPVVGTTLDYLDFRGLRVAQGRSMAFLGDCVLGARLAERLGIGAGENLVSAPENPFDLAGVYPLKMTVAGVLVSSGTPDDEAIFVDLKTAWVIEGIGHGHQDLAASQDESLISSRTDRGITANAKLKQYMEIDPANLASFHFHGDPASYPITAVLAVPPDQKSASILRGRFLAAEETNQIVKPSEVIAGLLQNVFRIKQLVDAVIVVVALATVMAIALVLTLSLRLRQREMHTVVMLGGSRLTVVRLMAAEVFIIVLMSALLCLALMRSLDPFAGDLARWLFVR